jgi:hypothetical protein
MSANSPILSFYSIQKEFLDVKVIKEFCKINHKITIKSSNLYIAYIECLDFRYIKNLQLGILLFKTGQGFITVITFSKFDPLNVQSVDFKLSNLKIFGRNLERTKVIRVKYYLDNISLYFRS